MILPRLVFHVFVAACLFIPGVACAEEAHFKTPEDAITAYIDAVSKQDFNAILATTAVDHMSRGFDFLAQAERLKTMTPMAAMPTSDPFFIEINKAIFTTQVARQIQNLTYSLMSTSDIVNGINVGLLGDNSNAAVDFVSVIQAKRLSALSLSKIGVPNPTQLNKDRIQVNFVKTAHTYGADMLTERVALVSFDGLNFMLGFSLFRYGDDWLVSSQVSNFAETSSSGAAKRTTPADFENILK